MNQGTAGEGGVAAVRIEDLLAEAGWIRSLARSLVPDGQGADDVVQETWMAVLRKPPLADRPLRPWLARVVINFARMQGRAERSRHRREASVARGEALPSSAEMLAQVELHRVLAEVVAGLEEPLRETVLLRYFAGLSSAEIARRTGTPPGTVRWRLKRGLEELRLVLDRRPGGRASWLPAVLVLGRGPRLAPPAAAAGSGGLPAAALLAAALVLALTAGGAWVLSRPLARGGPDTPALAAAPVERAPAPAARALAAAPAQAEPPRVALGPGGDLAFAAEPCVTLRAVDPDGLALAGATLCADGGSSARADASGRVRLALLAGVRELRLEAEGHVARSEPVHVGTAGQVELGTLVLERAGSLAGRVLDEHGRGLAGALVAVEAIGSRWMEAPYQPLEEARYLDGMLERGAGPLARVAADAAGRFAVEGLPAGFCRVWASAPGRVTAYSEPLGIAPGRVARAEPLALRRPAPGELLRGRVVDASGRGAYPARVEAARHSVDPLLFEAQPYVARASTDAEGRFELVVQPGRRYDLGALSDDGSAWAAVGPVEAGALGLRLELAARGTLRLVWGEDAAAEELSVKLLDARRGRPLAVQTLDAQARGRTLRAPCAPFALRVERAGCEPVDLGPFDPEAVPDELFVSFAPHAGAAGTVTAAGLPVAGALVTVLEPAPDPAAGQVLTLPTEVLDGPPFSAWVRPLPWVHRTATDAAGRFRLPEFPGRELVLRVEAPEGMGARGAPELAPAFLGPLELSSGGADGAAPPLAIELDRGGTVTGRVVLAGGADPAGVVVGLSVGDGRLRTQRAAPDGSFRFEAVPPGPVQLRRLERETRAPLWQRPLGRARLEPPPAGGDGCGGVLARGGVLDVELDLRAAAPTGVAGRFTIDGRPPGPWQVRLLPRAEREPADRDGGGESGARARAASGVVAPDGRFELAAPRAGAYVLELWNAGFEPVFCVVRDELELAPGSVRQVTIDYLTGELRGRVGAPYGRDVHHVWSGGAGLTVTTRLEGDAEGRCAVRVPAGAAAVLRGEEELARVELDPGGRVELELP